VSAMDALLVASARLRELADQLEAEAHRMSRANQGRAQLAVAELEAVQPGRIVTGLRPMRGPNGDTTYVTIVEGSGP
jgi:hypothetical protein